MAVKVKWNVRDFERIRTENKVEEDLRKRAERIASAANADGGRGGYVAEAGEGRTRARAAVVTTDYPSMVHAARGGLVRALDAGRR